MGRRNRTRREKVGKGSAASRVGRKVSKCMCRITSLCRGGLGMRSLVPRQKIASIKSAGIHPACAMVDPNSRAAVSHPSRLLMIHCRLERKRCLALSVIVCHLHSASVHPLLSVGDNLPSVDACRRVPGFHPSDQRSEPDIGRGGFPRPFPSRSQSAAVPPHCPPPVPAGDPMVTAVLPLGARGKRVHVAGQTRLNAKQFGPTNDPGANFKYLQALEELRKQGGG